MRHTNYLQHAIPSLQHLIVHHLIWIHGFILRTFRRLLVLATKLQSSNACEPRVYYFPEYSRLIYENMYEHNYMLKIYQSCVVRLTNRINLSIQYFPRHIQK
jgi:hypothetical protein